jgi:hypothetical protein
VSEDPNHPWGSGATRYHWTPEVSATVQLALNRFPRLTANTYVCHPWCGWSAVSVDYWDRGGRGDPAPFDTLRSLRTFLMNLDGRPFIRHTILRHQLWTSWGGYSRWTRDDHSGNLQHLHVTYWQ